MRKVRSKKRKIAKKLFAPLLVILGTIIIISNLPKEILISKKENKEITWNEFAGERIPSEYKNFTTNEYEEYTYNLDTKDNKSSFSVLLPKGSILNNSESSSIKYYNDNVEFTITKTQLKNFNEECKNIEEIYTNSYDRVYIKNTKYDENIFAIIIEYAKYNSDRTKLPFNQEVRIYIKSNNDEYIQIKTYTYNKRISEDVISKIINSINIKNNQIEFCQKSNCIAELSTLSTDLNKSLILKVDKSKYVHQSNDGLNIYNANFVTKEYAKVSKKEDGIRKYTSINVKLIYNENYLNNIPELKKVKISGKELLKSTDFDVLDETIRYYGTYIYKITDKLMLVFEIDSRKDNLDEVIEDFINFELK